MVLTMPMHTLLRRAARRSLASRRAQPGGRFGRVGLALLLGLVLAACHDERRGQDSDGDGLTDRQERRWKTDPNAIDSDGDGLADGDDPDPRSRLALRVDVGPVVKDELSWRAPLTLRVERTGGDLVAPEPQRFQIATDLGEASGPTCGEDLACLTAIESSAGGRATVTVRYDGPDGLLTTTELVDFPSDLVYPQPGVNTGTFRGAGGLDGELRVFTTDADSANWEGQDPLPYADAFVQVDLPDGRTLRRRSDYRGQALFLDAGLVGPVTVTVGAAGARYTTLYGVDAKAITVPIAPLAPVPGVDDERVGSLTGVVRGFTDGHFGFTSDTSILGKMNIAIVQVALRNVPLSSISAGSILEPAQNAFPPLPSNMVFLKGEASDPYRIDNLWPGRYLVFALAGEAREVLATLDDPYSLQFTPRALAIREVEVGVGETTEDLELNLDLAGATAIPVSLATLPNDPGTGEPLVNGLLLPVMETGKGFVFVDVNGAYRQGETPSVRFPSEDDAVIRALGLTLDPLVVGLAGRATVFGADPPGISTIIRHRRSSTAPVDYADPQLWPSLPVGRVPEPPVEPALDAVGGVLRDGRFAWEVFDGDRDPEMFVLRINYMTPAIPNPGKTGWTIGGPRSHALWELYVPGDRREITLPALPADAPGQPILRNPLPNLDDEGVYQHYDEDTLEIELNVYALGTEEKPFDYGDDFLFSDVNLNATGVSQDSYLFRVPRD